MKNYEEAFDEKTIKDVVYAAILMSYIDGEFHEKELDVVQSFAAEYWEDEFEDFDAFQEKAMKNVKKTVDSKSELSKTIDNVVGQLVAELTSQQRNVVLNLLGEVIVADGVMSLAESKLFSTFMDKMGIRIY